MTADQYIKLRNGKFALRRDVGALRYIYPFGFGTPHLHWHYVGTELYALYRAGHFGHFRRSKKQGFCMSEPPSAFPDYCGYKKPGELSQVVGIYARESDYYGAGVEGQYIDITGLSPGKYVLINWVNSRCLIKERTYADNAASTTITLTYSTGTPAAPTVKVGAEVDGVPHPPCPAHP